MGNSDSEFLGVEDLEPMLDVDHANEYILHEHFNFNPKEVLNLLKERAIAEKYNPQQFQDHMRELIRGKNMLDQELSDETSEAEDHLHTLDWYQNFLRLRSLYGVSDEERGDKLETTFSRLGFIFPIYYLPLQNALIDHKKFPAFFHHPEFGGLIPDLGKSLHENVTKFIITLHLCCLKLSKPSIPLRTQQVLLKRRIERSVVSNERKIRFLENNGVISSSGELLLYVSTSYDCGHYSDSYKLNWESVSKSINWELFDPSLITSYRTLLTSNYTHLAVGLASTLAISKILLR